MKPKLTDGVHKIMVSIPSITAENFVSYSRHPRWRHLATSGLLCAVLVVMAQPIQADTTATGTATDGTENPYKAIPVRNAFGIRPPPPVAPPPPPPIKTPEAPPSNVSLTGFAVVRGVKKVYLQVTPQGKPPVYIDLEEDEMREDIKVVEINAKKEYAKILNSGQEVTLNFKQNGLKTAASAAAPVRPQVPARPGVNPGVQQRGQQGGRDNQRGRPPAPVAPTPTPTPTVIGRGGAVQGGFQQTGVGAPNDGRRMGGGRNFNNVAADPLLQGQMPPTPTPVRGRVVPTPP